MKKPIMFSLFLILIILLCSTTTQAAITQSNNNLVEDQTNVWTETPNFSILLNTSVKGSLMDGNITLKKGSTTISNKAFLNQANGTQTLTFSSIGLDGSTDYTIYVNVNDTSGWNNISYNFTTGFKRPTDNSNFNVAQATLIGVILTIVIAGYSVMLWKDFSKGKIELGDMFKKLFLMVLLATVITTIAAVI